MEPEAISEHAHQQRQDSRAQQRHGGDDADLQRAVAEERQVVRQQQRDVAIGERADSARREDQPRVARCAGRKPPGRCM